MLISKPNRKAIYEYLFSEGVVVVMKNTHIPQHPEIPVSNLEVMKAMQSLKSRGYVKEQFAWRHFYYYLTNDGIDYIREYLHLPQDVIPSTLMKSSKAPSRAMPREGPRRDFGGSDRDAYRRDEKSAGAGGEFAPEFRGGYGGAGRGAPRQ
eukprot:Clim_evm48s156 gene=Clim_evmTU48s156